MGPRYVEISKVGTVGFVDVVVDFEQGDVRLRDDRVEEDFRAVGVEGADEEVLDQSIEDSNLSCEVYCQRV